MLEQEGLDRIEFHYKCTILKGTVQQQLVAHTPSVGEDSVAIRHEPELKGAFKALRDRGICITSYRED